MIRVAGALLAGLSLLGVIALHIGYQWVIQLRGPGAIASITEIVPLPVLGMAYGGFVIGLVLLLRNHKGQQV